MPVEREAVFFEDRLSLRNWLSSNHHQKDGIWAQFYKKSTGLSDLSWEALVEECLCFGWIDSVPGKVDEQRTAIYISPRKLNSGWSRRNKLVLQDLKARGLLQEPGLQAIERAKSNGSWERFDLAEDLVVPTELESALRADEGFNKAWDWLTESKRRQFLQQIYDAKAFETRQKRILAIKDAICSNLPSTRSRNDKTP